MSLGPEPGFVARMIRNDQDSLTQLLQLGLVVLVRCISFSWEWS